MNERSSADEPGIISALLIINIFVSILLAAGAIIAVLAGNVVIAVYFAVSTVFSAVGLWIISTLLRWVWDIRCYAKELVGLPKPDRSASFSVNPNSVSTITPEERSRRQEALRKLDSTVFNEG
ncbi:hypothetical protein OKA04_12710 [Luteolibacter flavescens]|uniref:Uncharacterized protein n=1 Tax=Luteolibacter flavescens TaxID=1859460 RepID=A0ABT3FQ67_9BACT|nr:hypothetical protein [Luteolibacter flavescens]MCW1885592.1 hypothetical protein [Luteolibacter flavescens]